MRERLARFMQGRYGVDKFSNFLVILALVLMVLEIFIPFIQMRRVLNSIGLLLLIYAYFRIFSRNHYKRYAENERYMKYHNKVRFFFARRKSHMEQRRTHHIYKCPSCKQKIRVPKGKGKIAITCPKCRTEFVRRS
ncbi:MAG: hypothetical protein HFH73_01320 [Lachnospiraceae bacterium]|jgi:uncharacterized paraquat-inducible protein A|nr:hypothetical protein [Lachnospiraceae bacterium]